MIDLVKLWATTLHRQHLRRILLLLVIVVIAGCRQESQTPNPMTGIKIDLRVEPDPPAVGDTTLIITLTGPDGAAIDDANISVRGDMDHAGMEPVEGSVSGGVNGEYRVPLAWSMGGGWIVTVKATLPENRGVVEKQFDLFVEAVSRDSIIDQESTNESTDESGP